MKITFLANRLCVVRDLRYERTAHTHTQKNDNASFAQLTNISKRIRRYVKWHSKYTFDSFGIQWEWQQVSSVCIILHFVACSYLTVHLLTVTFTLASYSIGSLRPSALYSVPECEVPMRIKRRNECPVRHDIRIEWYRMAGANDMFVGYIQNSYRG